MGRSLKKGPFTDNHLSKKVEVMNEKSREDSGEDMVAPLDHRA